MTDNNYIQLFLGSVLIGATGGVGLVIAEMVCRTLHGLNPEFQDDGGDLTYDDLLDENERLRTVITDMVLDTHRPKHP